MALIEKLAWKIKNDDSQLSSLIRARFISSFGAFKSGYKKSSIWPGVKRLWSFVIDNEKWFIGNGHRIDFWHDIWWGKNPIRELAELPDEVFSPLNHSVADFIENDQWFLPHVDSTTLKNAFTIIKEIKLPSSNSNDRCLWGLDTMGVFSMKFS
ncbi:uncharacterized protein LOC122056935 [Macadamia integrifolia]|uniref:uncharacterized protein LOC122056935 n=1 Tax=Macadamia integrifolia TaxID=60698 RepID=UPI001C52917A|nr:uncharacterized protein LOC122056935 [Macadamia integrifolia]